MCEPEVYATEESSCCISITTANAGWKQGGCLFDCVVKSSSSPSSVLSIPHSFDLAPCKCHLANRFTIFLPILFTILSRAANTTRSSSSVCDIPAWKGLHKFAREYPAMPRGLAHKSTKIDGPADEKKSWRGTHASCTVVHSSSCSYSGIPQRQYLTGSSSCKDGDGTADILFGLTICFQVDMTAGRFLLSNLDRG